ncbi:MAG: TetR/AcrR family transcriptional regulator [Planctomycetota bacterium]
MRYTPDQKHETRCRILAAAAKRFLADGYAGASVQHVMRDAGLTHGGFYNHFKSKHDLLLAVFGDDFDRLEHRLDDRLHGLAPCRWLAGWFEAYLSDAHHAHPERGCPLPVLAAEIARGDAEARSALTDFLNGRLATMSERMGGLNHAEQDALLAGVAQAVGALMLSRAVDEPLATRVRSAAQNALKTSAQKIESDKDLPS